MEKVLSIVTVNTDGNKNISSNTGTMTHEKNPFRISDIKLPQYSTGHFYMLLYLRGGIYFYWCYIFTSHQDTKK